MRDLEALFERQRQWQQARARLSWSEKLTMAETLRDAAVAFRTARLRKTAERSDDRGWTRDDLYLRGSR
jgi:hypothetical protein